MLHVEIAKGRSAYKPTDLSFNDIEEAMKNLSLEDGQKARLKDEDGSVIERITAESLEAAKTESAAEDNAGFEQGMEGESEEDSDVSDYETAGEDDETREIPDIEIPNKPNKALMESQTGIISLGRKNREDAWETAIDVVNYPVHIVEAFFKRDGDYVPACGHTNTGRDTCYNFVVVDRDRTGNYNPIAAVTDRYGSMRAPSVYADLRQYLDQDVTGYKLREVYVSGDGGAQQLVIECKSSALIQKDDLRMMLVVDTSSDGSTAHQITMVIWHKEGKFRMPVPMVTQKLAARHTTTLHRRSIDFAPSVSAMIKAWSDEIVPMMQVFADFEFDKDMALDELDRVAKEAGIGKRKRSQLVETYKEGSLNIESDYSAYSVYGAASEYIEEEAITREAADRWRYNLSKSMKKDYRAIESGTKKAKKKAKK